MGGRFRRDHLDKSIAYACRAARCDMYGRRQTAFPTKRGTWRIKRIGVKRSSVGWDWNQCQQYEQIGEQPHSSDP
jgi:hypothetical protein